MKLRLHKSEICGLIKAIAAAVMALAAFFMLTIVLVDHENWTVQSTIDMLFGTIIFSLFGLVFLFCKESRWK